MVNPVVFLGKVGIDRALKGDVCLVIPSLLCYRDLELAGRRGRGVERAGGFGSGLWRAHLTT